MRRARQEVYTEPTCPSSTTALLRVKLIHEELGELIAAIQKVHRIPYECLPEVADAIGDLLYVVYGTAVAFGLPAQKIFDEVHRSNMSKFDDGMLGPDGKWIKGPSYQPANMKQFV